MAGIGADVDGMVDSRRFQALVKLQFHMLARSDDMAHIKKANLTTSLQFPKYLTVKLRWSKNVCEERDCPRQLILGSVDINRCPVVGLACFLEAWIRNGNGAVSQWLFGDGTTTSESHEKDQQIEANRLKAAYSGYINLNVLNNPLFKRTGGKGYLEIIQSVNVELLYVAILVFQKMILIIEPVGKQEECRIATWRLN